MAVFIYSNIPPYICRQYKTGWTLTYICFDSTQGVDAGTKNKIEYECKHDIPYVLGKYDVPKQDELWPLCETKTTTVMPGEI